MAEAEAERRGVSLSEAYTMVLKDRELAPRLRPGAPIIAAYVDNANYVCWSMKDAADALEALESVLQRKGLAYRVECPAARNMEAIGLSFDGKLRVIANTPRRTWRLLAALHQLRRQGRCSGDTMRVVAGHL
eukprot:2175735-Heterocapsa_arctica.AAC.1